jgi:hypothetical protein
MRPPRHRADHLQRHGCRDPAKLLQGSRLCRMARAGSEANLDRGPHDPRQNIEAGQLLTARSVRAWVVLVKVKPTRWEGHGLRPCIEAAKKRLHHNVLAIVLANKLARIIPEFIMIRLAPPRASPTPSRRPSVSATAPWPPPESPLDPSAEPRGFYMRPISRRMTMITRTRPRPPEG